MMRERKERLPDGPWRCVLSDKPQGDRQSLCALFRKGVSVELKDLITGAQEAMDQGDYRLAIAASEHALVGYSSCLAAHRVLGEAYLERGNQQAATDHFERTLSVDPLNVVARLGLGVASEESKKYEDAYGHYLHAWEINPALDQVRDELVRLRGLLNVEDRLHPTRAGLAGIHARCGQFARAAAEWRAVLSVEPDSRRARTSLAELLWRQGDDNGALAAAREALRGCPENARALAIMADIERRRGGVNAEEFAQRFASVDPTGEVLDYLQHWRSDTDLRALLPDSILIDEFDFESNRSLGTSGLNRKGITGSLSAAQMAAPDLWDTLVKDLTIEGPAKDAPTLATGVEPFSWADGPRRDDAMAGQVAPAAPAALDDSDLFPQLADVDDGHSPVEVEATDSESAMAVVEPAHPTLPVAGFEDDAELLAAEPFDPGFLDTEESTPAGNALSGHEAAVDDVDLDIVPFSMDQLTGTVTPGSPDLNEAALSASFGELESTADPEPGASHLEPYVDPFVAEDGRIDLTAGWDKLDQELEAATPPASGNAGFDSLVAELDVDGIIPFNATVESPDEDAWSPFSEVDFDVPVSEVEPVADLEQPGIDLSLPDATGEALDIAELEAFDVNAFIEPEAEPAPEPAPTLGKDIVAGIPLPEPSGYTALLANIDEESLPEVEAHQEEAIDPFANPDASGSPLAFDELIEVTSSDGYRTAWCP